MLQHETGRGIQCLGFAALLATLAACGRTPPPQPGIITAVPQSALGQEGYKAIATAEYLMRPSDVIAINVFREPDLSQDNMIIAPDGTVSLKLIGRMKAGGVSADQFARMVTGKLRETYLLNPHVSVNVAQYASNVVTVEGAVSEPGVYQLRPGSRLSAAIASARGLSRVAKLKEVFIFRDTKEGISVARFDYAAINVGQMIDPIVEPSDRIVVGVSSLSQAWQDLLKTAPAIAIFQRF